VSVPRPGFRPPTPVGEPFRGDPDDAAPFPTEGSAPVAAVLVPAAIPAFAAASDVAPAVSVRPIFRRPNAATETPDRRSARAALAIGLISLLVLPLALGPLAIVLGVRSMRRGERRLGVWAIAAGAAGTVLGIVGVILWATGVLPNLDELLKVG
jgi:lipopolysaccharide export LptBFGC system permease protein LptF